MHTSNSTGTSQANGIIVQLPRTPFVSRAGSCLGLNDNSFSAPFSALQTCPANVLGCRGRHLYLQLAGLASVCVYCGQLYTNQCELVPWTPIDKAWIKIRYGDNCYRKIGEGNLSAACQRPGPRPRSGAEAESSCQCLPTTRTRTWTRQPSRS